MKKFAILFVLAAMFAFALPVSAAKPTPSGTISIPAGSDLNLGGVVTFDTTVSDLPGWANPRIQVMCTQGGVVVYGEAHNVDGHLGPVPFDGPGFQLGGGGSDWLTNGGPAECVATLYYWRFSPAQTFNPLAEISFSAGG